MFYFFEHLPYNVDIFIKIGLAAGLSLLIGLERELKKKPVGLKTSLVISVFSCLLTYISIEAAYTATPNHQINITMDPLRLAAQIVSGIGFLGAGVILRRGNDSISGLTTAAMIWGAGGIGIAVGAGFYFEATLSVIIILIGIEFIPPFLTKIGPKRLRMREIYVKVQISNMEQIQNFIDFLNEEEMHIENIRIRDLFIAEDVMHHELELRMSALPRKQLTDVYELIHSLPYIDQVEIEILN